MLVTDARGYGRQSHTAALYLQDWAGVPKPVEVLINRMTVFACVCIALSVPDKSLPNDDENRLEEITVPAP